MATFPTYYQPVYSATKTSQPKVTKVQYGDGYEMRATFGLNQNPKEWQLEYSVSDTEANEIEAFLDARLGQEAFDWTAPDGTTGKRWVCESWNRQLFDFQRSKVSITFRQVFEP
jgi:phage-related protein